MFQYVWTPTILSHPFSGLPPKSRVWQVNWAFRNCHVSDAIKASAAFGFHGRSVINTKLFCCGPLDFKCHFWCPTFFLLFWDESLTRDIDTERPIFKTPVSVRLFLLPSYRALTCVSLGGEPISVQTVAQPRTTHMMLIHVHVLLCFSLMFCFVLFYLYGIWCCLH